MKQVFSLILLFALTGPATADASPPAVVVSIKPLHSLVSAIMHDIAEPHLLLGAGETPHGYNMRPSELRLLQEAELIVWGGPELESFMTKYLDQLDAPEKTMTLLADQSELKILPARAGGVWQSHGADRHSEHRHDHDIDPHIWLSPFNARVIATAVTYRLIALDPGNRVTYENNRDELTQRLIELETDIDKRLGGLEDRSYLVFHDAYQYFENAFGLRPAGALSIDPERRPGAKRLAELKHEIRQQEIVCIFTEPQFLSRLVSVLAEGTGARIGVLDPLGADLEPGANLYFTLMRNMAENLQGCLAEKNQ